jgi:hypothetical protein
MITSVARQLLFAAFLLLLAGACASMSDIVRDGERDEGTTQIYSVPIERAWDIARSIFLWEGGAERFDDRRNDGYILASSGIEPFSWGAYMGVWIKPIDASRIRVTIVTKRKVSTNFVTALTESTFHERFAEGAARESAHKSRSDSP